MPWPGLADLEVVGEGGDLVGLVPREDAQVVGPHRRPAPLVVRGHHQDSRLVIAALLARPWGREG